MKNINQTLTNWLQELEEFKLPTYEQFPDIDLYMDQVVNFLDRELSVLKTSSLDKVITPSMINNYVKGEVVDAPLAKKYNKKHLALINETCSLKQVLSIAEIKQILDSEYQTKSNSDAYNEFKELSSIEFNNAINMCNQSLNDIEENDSAALTNLALKMAINANAYITVAKRILYYTRKYKEMNEIKEELQKNKEQE